MDDLIRIPKVSYSNVLGKIALRNTKSLQTIFVLVACTQVENVRMVDRYNAKKPFIGNLFLTSSHLVFKDPEYRKEVWVRLMT